MWQLSVRSTACLRRSSGSTSASRSTSSCSARRHCARLAMPSPTFRVMALRALARRLPELTLPEARRPSLPDPADGTVPCRRACRPREPHDSCLDRSGRNCSDVMTMEPDERPGRPETGEPAVDAALTNLDELAELPVAEHVGVFDESHRQLQDALADLDEE